MNSAKYEKLYDKVISNYTYAEILEIYGIDRVVNFIKSDTYYTITVKNVLIKDMLENWEPEQYIDSNQDNFIEQVVDFLGDDIFLDILDQRHISSDLVKELLPNLILRGEIGE